MTNARSAAFLSQRETIVNLLKQDNMTLSALAQRSGLGYYTCRSIVNKLLTTDIVRVVGSYDRHRMFGYNHNSRDIHDTLPRIIDILNRQSSKIIFLLSAVGKEDSMKGTIAVKSLPRYVAELMETANIASHDLEVTARLDSLRDSIQRDYLYVKNMAGIYEQILSEPSLWDPKYLKEMVNDPDYNFLDVQSAKDYYNGK